MGNDTSLDQAILGIQAAIAEFIQGKPETWKALCSHRDDASLFGGWGGWERGWEQLGPRYDWAAARFAGGEVAFEEIADTPAMTLPARCISSGCWPDWWVSKGRSRSISA